MREIISGLYAAMAVISPSLASYALPQMGFSSQAQTSGVAVRLD